jgi:hypothetical protein
MSAILQNFLLKNTKVLQFVFNQKLGKRKGGIGKFFRWIELGKRQAGEHVIPKFFRLWNTYWLNIGYRFNWGRPHLTKFFTKERDMFMTGYAGFFILWAWFVRKNKVRPLFMYKDMHLHDYDNPAKFTYKYGMFVPLHVANFKISAHYLEINKIFHQEMLKKYMDFRTEFNKEFEHASEKDKRTRYILNSNYVYEPFGWELANK